MCVGGGGGGGVGRKRQMMGRGIMRGGKTQFGVGEYVCSLSLTHTHVGTHGRMRRVRALTPTLVHMSTLA